MVESAMLRCRNCSGLRILSLFTSSCLLLLATAVVPVSGRSCPFPCDPPTTCSDIDVSNCQYGIVKDGCECCDACGLGPGADCTLGEKCGPEYECVRQIPDLEGIPPNYNFTDQQIADFPGICRPRTTPLSPIPPSPPSTTVHVDSHNDTVDCGSSASEEDDDDGPMDENNCRPKCSIEFCSQRSSQRICSAQGMELTKVSQRNGCQHTSCFACYIIVKPPCDHRRCPEPPNKRCLREFYECILDHYYHAVNSDRPHLLRINDPRRNFYPGMVYCDVPEVQVP